MRFVAINKHKFIFWTVLFSVFLLFSAIFAGALMPIFSVDGYRFGDDLIFEIIGKAWSQGTPAYTYYLDHKGPFVFLFFCLGYLVNGTRNGLMRLFVVWNAISMTLCYCLITDFKVKVFNMKSVVIKSCLVMGLFVYFWVVYDIVFGVTIGRILTPCILGCLLLFKYWSCNDNFLSNIWSHILYGVFCSIIVLSRASDAVGVFLLYVAYWLYHLIKKHQVWKTIQKALFTILGGLIPFILCLIYFGYYGVIDTFMDCTFWANLRYTVPEINTGYRNGAYVIVVLFIIVLVVIVANIFCSKFRSIASNILGAVLLLELAFIWFCTAGYIQYTITLVLLIAAYLSANRQIIGFIVSKQKILFAVVISLCFISCTTLGIILESTILECSSMDAFSDICDEIIGTEKSILVLDCDGLIGALMDKGYMPKSRYCMFQTWHLMCGVANETDMVNAFEEDGVDEVWYFCDVGKPLPGWLNHEYVGVYEQYNHYIYSNDYLEADCYIYKKMGEAVS